MSISGTVLSLLENDREHCLAAVNSLLKIANNILKHPGEAKYRSLNLNSEIVETTILPAIGAFEVLFLMGFEEEDDKLILPLTASNDNVVLYKNELEILKNERLMQKYKESVTAKKTTENKTEKKRKARKNNASYLQRIASEPDMKNELIHRFQSVVIYESPALQERGRCVLPIQELNRRAREQLNKINCNISPNDKPMDFQDCLLIELLAWFKNEYFSWFDVGRCETCQMTMKSLKYVEPLPDERSFGASRVEGYQCESCGKEERFPRYIHPGALMETKRGRCMEWASCFTFMCRTLGFDSRYVVDETDHVWTEVYSQSQNRWLHADPCENKLDTPLLYEIGWKKKLSYIFAYSKDEIVDCVWRYSANHADVCSRRTRCREDWLAAAIFALNEERQRLCPPQKKNFLELRRVQEIVEFMKPPSCSKGEESEGRLSGSMAWRLSRGETTEDQKSSYIFSLSDEERQKKEMIVKYSTGQDLYVRPLNKSEISGWRNGIFSCSNIFRKHEHDWKTVYIARQEGCDEGTVKWKIEWANQGLKLKSVLAVLQHKLYENGAVHWQLCSGNLCYPGKEDGVLELSAADLDDKITSIEISAELRGGRGDVAWQHAQLFRQGEKDKEFPFFVHLTFD